MAVYRDDYNFLHFVVLNGVNEEKYELLIVILILTNFYLV